MLERLIFVPAITAAFLMAAHFLRRSDIPLALLFFLAPSLFLFRWRWVLRLFQVALVLSLLIWVETTIELVQRRLALDLPWLRLILIMGGIIAFSAWSIHILHRPQVLQKFPVKNSTSWHIALFLVIFVSLTVISFFAPIPMLLSDRFWPGYGILQAFFFAIYGSWLGGKLLEEGFSSQRRLKIWGLFSIVFFGQFFIALAGVASLLQTGVLHWPIPALIVAGPVYRGEGFFMLSLYLATVLLVGPAWCSHLCYIGAIDQSLATFNKARPKGSCPPGKLPFCVLALVLIAAYALRDLAGEFQLVFWFMVAFVMVSMFKLFSSLKRGRMVHCSDFCPIGVVSTTLGGINPFRLKINSACTSCQACLSECPYGALSSEGLKHFEVGRTCTLCGDCLQKCPHHALELSLYGVSTPIAKPIFIFLIVTLHSVFLAVARV